MTISIRQIQVRCFGEAMVRDMRCTTVAHSVPTAKQTNRGLSGS